MTTSASAFQLPRGGSGEDHPAPRQDLNSMALPQHQEKNLRVHCKLSQLVPNLGSLQHPLETAEEIQAVTSSRSFGPTSDVFCPQASPGEKLVGAFPVHCGAKSRLRPLVPLPLHLAPGINPNFGGELCLIAPSAVCALPRDEERRGDFIPWCLCCRWMDDVLSQGTGEMCCMAQGR